MSDSTAPVSTVSTVSKASTVSTILSEAAAVMEAAQAALGTPATPVAAAPVDPTVKPGYKTSEFWLTAVHSIFALLAGSGVISGFTDPTVKSTTLASAGVSLVLYIFSRITAKAK